MWNKDFRRQMEDNLTTADSPIDGLLATNVPLNEPYLFQAGGQIFPKPGR